MTRSVPNPNLVELESEIKRTLRLTKTSRRRLFDTIFVENYSGVAADHSSYNSPISVSSLEVDSCSNFDFDFVISILFSNHFTFPVDMTNQYDRTLKELATPNVNYQALTIQYPDLDADCPSSMA